MAKVINIVEKTIDGEDCVEFSLLKKNTLDTSDMVVTLNKEDFNKFVRGRGCWYIQRDVTSKYYLQIRTRSKIFNESKLSRLIAREAGLKFGKYRYTKKAKVIDHRNHNTLDNRRMNLGVMDMVENSKKQIHINTSTRGRKKA